jgi:hypothetical protein
VTLNLDPQQVKQAETQKTAAVRRWQVFTGLTACLHGDGRSYDVIATERLTDLQNTNPSPAPAQPVEIITPE